MTIETVKNNIRTALHDYFAHASWNRYVYDDVSNYFVNTLAEDSYNAKADLRALFSKSPAWNEKLDAMVINGTHTNDTDYSKVRFLFNAIMGLGTLSPEQQMRVRQIKPFFCHPELTPTEERKAIHALNAISPKAYAEGKKKSRVFKALCKSLGIADETAGSTFQQCFAMFADELNAKKLEFKLIVSINPAHFLTMSNPKEDCRGEMLTSCHSFNGQDYDYNNGCSGYARDETSFIVFTVDDPDNPELFNNRKTSRQVFAYRPGSGLLLQSRMYDTHGGVYGKAENATLYRTIIQKEISDLEGKVNMWKTKDAYNSEFSDLVVVGNGFGGYPDWTYESFDCHISVRSDCDAKTVEPLIVGNYGLCIVCGDECRDGLYCDDCNYKRCCCDECGYRYDEDDLTWVYDRYGSEIQVCPQCRDNYYRYCEECEAWYHQNNGNWIGDIWVCDRCLENEYDYCEVCNQYYRNDEIREYIDHNGNWVGICDDCFNDRLYDGRIMPCSNCNHYIEMCDDGTCPECGVVLAEDEDVA